MDEGALGGLVDLTADVSEGHLETVTPLGTLDRLGQVDPRSTRRSIPRAGRGIRSSCGPFRSGYVRRGPHRVRRGRSSPRDTRHSDDCVGTESSWPHRGFGCGSRRDEESLVRGPGKGCVDPRQTRTNAKDKAGTTES